MNGKISVDLSPAAAELELSGEVNQECVEELHREALTLADAGKNVVLQWERAEHLDASALQVLLALKAALAAAGHSLQSGTTGGGVARYLEIAGLSGQFEAVSS